MGKIGNWPARTGISKSRRCFLSPPQHIYRIIGTELSKYRERPRYKSMCADNMQSWIYLPSAKMTKLSPPTKCINDLPTELLVEIFEYAATLSCPIILKTTTKPEVRMQDNANSDRKNIIPNWEDSFERGYIRDLNFACVSIFLVLSFLSKSC